MITRLVSGLWGGKRNGSFVGKTTSGHPVGILTRPVSGLWGGQRNGSFANKGISVSPTISGFWMLLDRRRRRL